MKRTQWVKLFFEIKGKLRSDMLIHFMIGISACFRLKSREATEWEVETYKDLFIRKYQIPTSYSLTFFTYTFQILTTHAWAKYYWNDTRLKWDPADWDDNKIIHVEADKVLKFRVLWSIV